MVQIKMRPIFSRGNSVASISVAAPKQEDDDDVGDDSNEEVEGEREASRQQRQQRPQLRRPLRRRRPVDAHVTFAESPTEHPAGEPLTEKELKAYFYSVDDLKRFDRDRALTALMYRSGKHPSGGDGPWDDNVHSVRGLEDFLCGVPSRNRDICAYGGSSSPPPSSSSSTASFSPSRACYAPSGTDRERERREHVRAVLLEQARLRAEGQGGGSEEALVLQEVSSKSSCESRREAAERGRDDALAASRLDADPTTTNLLRTVRGRLYALMEKQPSLRSLGSMDRQPSLRSLLGGGEKQPSLRSLLGGGEKQPSIRNLAAAADKCP